MALYKSAYYYYYYYYCVSLFPLFFNFLFLKLQFMRIKMYNIRSPRCGDATDVQSSVVQRRNADLISRASNLDDWVPPRCSRRQRQCIVRARQSTQCNIDRRDSAGNSALHCDFRAQTRTPGDREKSFLMSILVPSAIVLLYNMVLTTTSKPTFLPLSLFDYLFYC